MLVRRQSSGAHHAARKIACIWLDDSYAAIAQLGQIRLRCRMFPHVHVHRRSDEHQLEVRDRARMLDSRVVDHGVAGDQGGDADAEGEPAGVGRRASADEEDARGDDRDAGRLGVRAAKRTSTGAPPRATG